MSRQEQIEAIQRECKSEGYDLTQEECEEVLADVREKGIAEIKMHRMYCWWEVMEAASRIVHDRKENAKPNR